jgi:hypothetical protein
MKRIRIFAMALFALVIVYGVTCVIRAALSQARPKAVVREGHWSPLEVKITFRDGKTKKALLAHAANWNSGFVVPQSDHQWIGRGDGNSKVTLWLDTIKAIKNPTDKDYTVVSKDGSERDMEYVDCDALMLVNGDDSNETVKLVDCKIVEFLKPARKDKKENAMFDQWKYSPYTGEKLED